MSEPDYVREKLWAAVAVLATGAGPAKERLAEAWTDCLFGLAPKDFEGDRSKQFEDVWGKVTGGSTIDFHESIKSMEPSDAHHCLVTIVGLFDPRL